MAEILALGAVATGANALSKAVTGKSLAEHGAALAEVLCEKLMGSAADKAGARVAKLSGAEEKARKEHRDEILQVKETLESVVDSSAVDDRYVRSTLVELNAALERARTAVNDAAKRSEALDQVMRYHSVLTAKVASYHTKQSDDHHAETMDQNLKQQESLDKLTAMVAKLNKDEPANQARYAYEPFDHRDSDQVASLLGEGSFGSIHTMKNADDGQVYAVKLIKVRKAKAAGVTEDMMTSEAARLSMLGHDNIVRYFTAFRFGENNKFYAIAMELLTGGSLKERLQAATGPLTSDTNECAVATVKWTTEVASALAYMHAKGVQHRDLKPDNVLFDEDGVAKIIDLGLAVVLKDKSCVSSAGGANKVGALNYQSPEKAKGQRYDGKDDPWRRRRRPRRQRRRVPVPARRRRRRRAHLQVDEDLVAAAEAAPLRREVVVVLAVRNARDRDDAPARQALDGALVVVGAHLRAPVVRARLAPLRVRAVPLL